MPLPGICTLGPCTRAFYYCQFCMLSAVFFFFLNKQPTQTESLLIASKLCVASTYISVVRVDLKFSKGQLNINNLCSEASLVLFCCAEQVLRVFSIWRNVPPQIKDHLTNTSRRKNLQSVKKNLFFKHSGQIHVIKSL